MCLRGCRAVERSHRGNSWAMGGASGRSFGSGWPTAVWSCTRASRRDMSPRDNPPVRTGRCPWRWPDPLERAAASPPLALLGLNAPYSQHLKASRPSAGLSGDPAPVLLKSQIPQQINGIESAGAHPSTFDVKHDQVGQKAQQDSLKVFVVGMNQVFITCHHAGEGH